MVWVEVSEQQGRTWPVEWDLSTRKMQVCCWCQQLCCQAQPGAVTMSSYGCVISGSFDPLWPSCRCCVKLLAFTSALSYGCWLTGCCRLSAYLKLVHKELLILKFLLFCRPLITVWISFLPAAILLYTSLQCPWRMPGCCLYTVIGLDSRNKNGVKQPRQKGSICCTEGHNFKHGSASFFFHFFLFCLLRLKIWSRGLLSWQKIWMLMSLKIHSGFAAVLFGEQFLFIPFVAKVQRHIKYIGVGKLP